MKGPAFGDSALSDGLGEERLAEATSYVIFGFDQLWLGEDSGGETVFDHVSEVHEGCVIADPGGLLHVMGDDENGEFSPQFVDKVFDFGCSDWVQGRARFVEQQYFGCGRNGSSYTEPLLLSAGES